VRNCVSEIGDGSRGVYGERETFWRKDSKEVPLGALTILEFGYMMSLLPR
jgi:hypothetical protein